MKLSKNTVQQKQSQNFGIDDGASFFVDEVSITVQPQRFVLDFKTITPRNDVRGNVVHIKHNVGVLEPYTLKNFLEILNRVIRDYEKKFGVIKKSKSLDIAEKITKEMNKKATVKAPEYTG